MSNDPALNSRRQLQHHIGLPLIETQGFIVEPQFGILQDENVVQFPMVDGLNAIPHFRAILQPVEQSRQRQPGKGALSVREKLSDAGF